MNVQIANVEDTTEGGLLMAGSSKEKPTLGTVPIPLMSLSNAFCACVFVCSLLH